MNGVRLGLELVEPIAPWIGGAALRLKRTVAGSKEPALTAEEQRK
jgi:hypothetical protein